MKLIKITILLVIITLIVTQTNVLDVFKPRTAYAVGDLNVDWGPGVMPGEPLFTISEMAPGDSTTKSVTIKNNAASARPIAIKGVSTRITNNLSDAMDITIKDGPTILYGPKTMTQFFADSQNAGGIPLATINEGQTRTISITASFQQNAGNEFQNAEVAFNIIVGISVDIPEACQDINLSGRFPIFGTSGNDAIRGTNKDDVIFGLEGDDTIDSGNGRDCIVGGMGNDVVNGGNGKDIIDGNFGNDAITGGNDADILTGSEGEDKVAGGNGKDMISGGIGSDVIEGGNGTDTILGDDGDDTIKGGNENDILNGGNGVDSINGDHGKDACVGEHIKNCELAL
jgi:Ca2+-binding RTX toxin-like protein